MRTFSARCSLTFSLAICTGRWWRWAATRGAPMQGKQVLESSRMRHDDAGVATLGLRRYAATRGSRWCATLLSREVTATNHMSPRGLARACGQRRGRFFACIDNTREQPKKSSEHVQPSGPESVPRSLQELMKRGHGEQRPDWRRVAPIRRSCW